MNQQEIDSLINKLHYGVGFEGYDLTAEECAWLLDVIQVRQIQEMEHENEARRFGPVAATNGPL